ncbi:hypothetical protein BH11BAC2_BH11BAC2_09510 [soil metagenome]
MKSFLLLQSILLFSFFSINAQSLTGIAPNTTVAGQGTLDVTITGPGVFLQQSSQNGNIYDIHLIQGATSIPIFDYFNFNFYTTCYNDSATTPINYPGNAPTGLYDLSVTTVDQFFNYQTFTLPQSFTIQPPDGNAIGNIYEDLNLNGIKDTGEPNLVSQGIVINPGNHTINTDGNGNFSYPLINGTYTITWTNNVYNYLYLSSDSASYTFTIAIANVNNLNFGLRRALTTITPNAKIKGYTVSTIIESRGLFTGTGSGNISQVRLYKVGYGNILALPNSINVIDSNTATANFLIPANAFSGVYDVIVTLTNAERHILPSAFTVLNPEAYLIGVTYIDMNANGIQDIGEYGISGQRVLSLPDSISSYSDINGHYSIGVSFGNHTIQWNPVNPALWILTSDSASYTVNAISNVDSLDFGIRTTNPPGSVNLIMTSSLRRCNSYHQHILNVLNTSNGLINGTAYFIKSPLMTSINSFPPPNVTNGDTLSWNLTNLIPFASGFSILISSYYPGAGSVVETKSIVNTDDGLGNILYSDTAISIDNVICGIDPNDKSVSPEGIGQDHLTLTGELLDYTIRFQNTGNDTAFNVVIYDNLDQNLDFTTLQVIGSSHAVQTEIDNNGRVSFTFANILLPDSNVNEPASNGFVRYTILPKTGLADSSVVTNQAFIVFDSNPAVVTNETFNTYVFVIPVGLNTVYLNDDPTLIYPNPFSDYTNILFSNLSGEKYKLTIYDIGGKMVKQLSTTGEHLLLKKESLQSGMYFYQLINASGTRKSDGKIIIE